jgi:predicted metalloprotease
MKITGNAVRISGVLAALVLGSTTLTACGSSNLTAGTAPSTQKTPSTSSSQAPSSPAPTSSPSASLPAGCHGGVARDLQSALAILTDGANCPGSVNAYWTDQLGDRWTETKFIAYSDGQIPNNACGHEKGAVADDFADNAFYCPQDDTIAYSRDLLNSLYAKGGPYLPVVVLEHEVGHRANEIDDAVGKVSRSEENQADCDAGVTTAYARTAGRLPLSDVIAAGRLLYQLGDTEKFGAEMADSPDAHGTPPQRLIAFGRGYLQNLDACRTLGESEDGSVA